MRKLVVVGVLLVGLALPTPAGAQRLSYQECVQALSGGAKVPRRASVMTFRLCRHYFDGHGGDARPH
jgi:hypothetical protein